jgi:eukaryotic-like serine/threonine-protein kinase
VTSGVRGLTAGVICAGLLLLHAALAGAADDGAPRAPLELRWRTPLTGSGHTPIATPVAAAGRVFVATSAIAAYDAASGAALWSRPVDTYIPRGIATDGGHVYVAERTIYALAAADGTVSWTFQPAANASLGVPALDQGVLYAGTAEHTVYAVQAGSGRQLWVADVAPGARFPTVVRGVAPSEGVVYVAAEQWRSANGDVSTGLLAALRAADGRLLWRAETPRGDGRQGFSAAPAVAGRYVVAGDALGNAVTAFDKDTGKLLWRFAGKSGFAGFGVTPAVRGETVYAASGDGDVVALRLATGELAWRTTTGGSNFAAALCRGLLVVSYQKLAVLDARGGAVLQHDVLAASREIISSGIATVDDTVVMSGPTALYSFRCAPPQPGA